MYHNKNKEGLKMPNDKIKPEEINLELFETFKDCKTKKEFQEFIFSKYKKHYGLKCTCDDHLDANFNEAAGHYHHCDCWKFCHAINRALDWSEYIIASKLAELENQMFCDLCYHGDCDTINHRNSVLLSDIKKIFGVERR